MIIEGVKLHYSQAAEVCGVSNTTAWRWATGKQKMPHACKQLLEFTVTGRVIPDDWHGWHFNDGKLWSPLDRGLTAVEIEQYSWTLSLWRSTLTENRQLLEYIDYLERVTPRAEVIPFPTTQARRSETEGREVNRFFNKEQGITK